MREVDLIAELLDEIVDDEMIPTAGTVARATELASSSLLAARTLVAGLYELVARHNEDEPRTFVCHRCAGLSRLVDIGERAILAHMACREVNHDQ